MAEKISIYTKILRFFLRDLYNKADTILIQNQQMNEKINNLEQNTDTLNKQTVSLDGRINAVDGRISASENEIVKTNNTFSERLKAVDNYHETLEKRLSGDDITTIQIAHRLEVVEDTLRSNGVIQNQFELFNKKTYSQSGEDSIIMYVMAMLGIPLSECTYLDLGANRPKSMSNTYFFYEQGARGVLVEANVSLIPDLENERRGDIILNKCITDKSGDKVQFNILNLDGLSKIGNTDDILKENPDARIEKTVEIETISVTDIINTYMNGKPPIILNLDIEGLEMDILESMDFENQRPLIMIIEMIPYSQKLSVGVKDEQLLEYVKSKGYTEYAFTGINSIFIDKTQL